MWWLVLYSLLACSFIMSLVWLWATKNKNAGVVDIFWSYNFPVIAFILLWMAPGYEMRKVLFCSMVIIAGLRLGTFLAYRIFSHIDVEEGRYQELRKNYAPNVNRRFFLFFQFQAVSNVILALPFFIITINPNPDLSWLEYTGFGIWIISILGETIADQQLSSFKKNPDNKGKVCQEGLWYYSRHPNYFFQWLMWVSYFVFALASPYGYLAIISPAIILLLILKVTGIPPTEAQAVRSKGDAYKEYQRTTSAFFPWFKKE